MEHLIDTEHGIPALLATVVIALVLHLLLKIAEFLYENVYKKKNELSDKSVADLTAALNLNTRSVEKLECSVKQIEKDINEFPKIKKDIRRAFSAIKIIAKDEWPAVRQSIMADEEIAP